MKRPTTIYQMVRSQDLESSRRPLLSQSILAALASALVITTFTIAAFRSPHPFDIRFNLYAILAIAGTVTCLWIFILLTRIKQKADELVWFSLNIACLGLWSAGDMFQYISASPETAAFWATFNTIGGFFMPVTIYLFALAYTHPKRAKDISTIVPLVIGALILQYFDYRTNIFSYYDAPGGMIAVPWGYVVTTAPAFILEIIWFEAGYIAALALLINFYRRTNDKLLKQQARLFVIALAIPVVGGTITDGILPALGFHGILPLAVPLVTITGIIIGYGIIKYRIFTFDPSLIAAGIMNTMDEAVVGITPDYHITFANPGAERMLGQPLSELSQRRLTEFLMVPWSAERLHDKLLAPLARHDHAQIPRLGIRAWRGRQLSVKISASKITGAADHLEGYVLVLTDVTELGKAQAVVEQMVEQRTRELEQTKTRLLASINSLKLGFLMTDARPEIILGNQAAHQMLELKDADAAKITNIQKTLGRVFNLKSLVQACLRQSTDQTAPAFDYHNRIIKPYVTPITENGVAVGCVVLLEDITESVILERAKDEFFAIASHELRTPLTAIRGNTSLIEQYFPTAIKDPQVKDMIHDIHTSSIRLINIVNDFLDASQLEQGQIHLNPSAFDVGKVAAEVLTEVHPVARDKNLYAELEPSDTIPFVWADPARTKQVIYNLVGNALKFTEKGGVGIRLEQIEAGVKITVIDTGRGIAIDNQRLLFRKFQQAGDKTSLTRDATNGTGLGLYISQRLVSAMGGQLKLESSEPGRGTSFSFTLPLPPK
jgi:PAS domain S-box-containing protein